MKSGRIRGNTKFAQEGNWCSVEECGRKVLAKNFCPGHYSQVSIHGSVQTKVIRNYRQNQIDKDGYKVCTRCSLKLSFKSFNKGNKTFDGYSNFCKTCTVVSKHGITREMFDEMLIKQSGLCLICSRQLDRPVIDHDHKCCGGTYSCGYCVRGIVCRQCNSAIGLAGDSGETLLKMAQYVSGQIK